MSSIAVSLVLVIFLMQMQKWMWLHQIDTGIAGYVGYIQITDTGFVDEASLDNSISLDQVDIEALNQIEGVRGVYPRIQSAALASIGIKSKFAGVMGFHPDLDNEELKLPQKLKEGELLVEGDRDILITENMAQYYKVGLNDTLILYGMGYQGFTAAGLYRIKGIINIPAGELSNMVYMSMEEAAYLFAAYDRVTAVLVNIEENADLYEIHGKVKNVVTDSSLIVRNWEEVLPEIKEGLEVDNLSNQLIYGILLVIVCFGIFGTIVMMYNERIFEFGILISIGMPKWKVLLTTLTEIYWLSILGILVSWIIVTPILLYFNLNPIPLSGDMYETMVSYGMEPIISTGLYLDVYLTASLFILIFTIVISLYVVFKLLKLDPLDAMRTN